MSPPAAPAFHLAHATNFAIASQPFPHCNERDEMMHTSPTTPTMRPRSGYADRSRKRKNGGASEEIEMRTVTPREPTPTPTSSTKKRSIHPASQSPHEESDMCYIHAPTDTFASTLASPFCIPVYTPPTFSTERHEAGLEGHVNASEMEVPTPHTVGMDVDSMMVDVE
ncbi:hypothetical protein HK102_001137 [Quaeritorhiza haematococci]|nr:hypothetical protein HK102_001137 [Quaeritorhiza haematococci]